MIILSMNDIMGAVAYNAYSMAPNHAPRKIESVMDEVKSFLTEHLDQPFKLDKTFWCKEFDPKDVYKFIHDMMFSIPEFQEWNLSQIEYEKGISVDDGNRSEFSFSSRYDVRDENFWKDDFIDFDAFVNNVCRVIDAMRDERGCIYGNNQT